MRSLKAKVPFHLTVKVARVEQAAPRKPAALKPTIRAVVYSRSLQTRAHGPVEVTAHGESVELCRPQILFPTQLVGTSQFEVSPDAKRFLMMQAPLENSFNLTLVVNWPEELKK